MTKCSFCNKELNNVDIQYKRVFDERIPCCRMCAARNSNKGIIQAKIRQIIQNQLKETTGIDIDSLAPNSAYSDIEQ